MLVVPLFGTSRMLVRAYECAVHEVDFPLDLALLCRFRLHLLEDLLPQPPFAPAVEASVNRLPWPIPLRQVAPRSTRSQDPQNAVDDLAMVRSRPTGFWLLRWKQRLNLLPFFIRQFMSAYHIPNLTDILKF